MDFAATQSRNAITGQFLVKGCHHIARQFALGYSYIPVTYGIQIFGRATELQTVRVRRTWLDKLQFWQRAYQTKIFDERREVYGRGRTGEASVGATLVAELAEKARRRRRGYDPTAATGALCDSERICATFTATLGRLSSELLTN